MSHNYAGACVALVALLSASAHATPEAAAVAAAAQARDVATVRALLKSGADVNHPQGDGMTALHWAAVHGEEELASMLLSAGANWRMTTRLGGYMPLHLAARSGAAGVITWLIEAGADINIKTATGATTLMLAAASGSTNAVSLLLERGAEVNAEEGAHGQTALMFAAARNRADVVRLLLSRGATPSVTTKVIDLGALTAAPDEDEPRQGQPPRPAAGRAPAPTPAGAAMDVPGVTRPYRYNELIGKQGGLTALLLAARQGARETALALVEGGADVNQVSPADRTSPLLIATINGHFDLGLELVARGADVNAAADNGVTPLYAAVNVQWAPKAFYPQPRAYLQQNASYLQYMKALLDKGADPNNRVYRRVWYSTYNFDNLRLEENGASAFWRAAYAADLEAMRLLVAHGADPHMPTVKPAGRTTRGVPGQLRQTRDVSGRDPLPVGGPGIPPLQAAAGWGYGDGFAGNAHRFAPSGMLAAVKYLVEELGADVNAEDYDGSTALHQAAARGDVEMILYLVAKGADPTRINREGQSTADMANGPVQRIEPFPEARDLLIKLGAKNSNKCVSC
ncbi:MAG TPA: ankyrin repeat domain-containing protein [Vicinamibacterales bacterium]|nr:ankyrin repeat domain-containing protein [Vicinamibacterales bacterium]